MRIFTKCIVHIYVNHCDEIGSIEESPPHWPNECEIDLKSRLCFKVSTIPLLNNGRLDWCSFLIGAKAMKQHDDVLIACWFTCQCCKRGIQKLVLSKVKWLKDLTTRKNQLKCWWQSSNWRTKNNLLGLLNELACLQLIAALDLHEGLVLQRKHLGECRVSKYKN